MTKAQAGSHLLTLAELQPSDALDAQWADGDVTDGVDIELPKCLDEDTVDTSRTAVAKFVTQSQFKLPAVEDHVTGYADAKAAGAAYDAAVARLEGCAADFVFQGTPAKGEIAPFEIPALGDEAQAWRTTVTIAGAQVAVTTIHVVHGDLEMALVHTDLGTPDPAKIVEIATKAAAHLG